MLVVVLLTGLATLAACDSPPTAEASPSPLVDACVDKADATRASVEGRAQWAAFCPGQNGLTVSADTPAATLTTHLDMIDGLVEADDSPPPLVCSSSVSQSVRLQIGYDDGEVVELVGTTGPGCRGRISANGTLVQGPVDLGVFGLVMSAFGRQFADDFETVDRRVPLACPLDPRQPGEVEVDGASAGAVQSYVAGRLQPMVMPLTAVRGILCTWERGREDRAPARRDLSAAEAEHVRIGLHSFSRARSGCIGSEDPTYTAVIEDETGTRRSVTVVGSECSTVIREGDLGLGFAWLAQ